MIIDLNDTNIRVGKGEQILLNSPGYAVIKDEKITFGMQAEKIKYIYPRNTHDDYWYRLGQVTIQSTSNQIRHNADLAYMQLAEIYEQTGKPAKWIIAVPASFNQEQLALLLGLLKAADFTEVQLIDSALLASINNLMGGEHIHLDIQLHQSVLTTLESGDKHNVTATNVLPDAGLLGIYEECAKLISNEFITQFRFDPHHHAESEQLLFENIPSCLNKLNTSPMSKVDIEYKGRTYSANISREAILEVLSPIYDGIYKNIDDTKSLLLSHRFSMLPGFQDNLSNVNFLDEFALFTSAKAYSTLLLNNDSNYLSELPTDEVKKNSNHSDTTNSSTIGITHVLLDGIAYKLNKQQDCYITTDNTIEASLKSNTCFSIRFIGGQFLLSAENNTHISLNNVIVKDSQSLKLGDNIKAAGLETNTILIKVS